MLSEGNLCIESILPGEGNVRIESVLPGGDNVCIELVALIPLRRFPHEQPSIQISVVPQAMATRTEGHQILAAV